MLPMRSFALLMIGLYRQFPNRLTQLRKLETASAVFAQNQTEKHAHGANLKLVPFGTPPLDRLSAVQNAKPHRGELPGRPDGAYLFRLRAIPRAWASRLVSEAETQPALAFPARLD